MKSPVAPTLHEVALIAAKKAAAGGDVSVSWWLEKVRIKEAPQPKIRSPRLTRWLATEVAQFWANFAADSTDPTALATAASVVARASKASAAARKPSAAANAKTACKARSSARPVLKAGA